MPPLRGRKRSIAKHFYVELTFSRSDISPADFAINSYAWDDAGLSGFEDDVPESSVNGLRSRKRIKMDKDLSGGPSSYNDRDVTDASLTLAALAKAGLEGVEDIPDISKHHDDIHDMAMGVESPLDESDKPFDKSLIDRSLLDVSNNMGPTSGSRTGLTTYFYCILCKHVYSSNNRNNNMNRHFYDYHLKPQGPKLKEHLLSLVAELEKREETRDRTRDRSNQHQQLEQLQPEPMVQPDLETATDI
jgi:hypothetical protein